MGTKGGNRMGTVLVENRDLAARMWSKKNRVISKTSPAMMIAEEDITQLLSDWRSVPAWIKDHVSTRQPIHRYEGELLIECETLVFTGHDIREGKDFNLEIPLANITDIGLRFSEQLKASIDRTFGIGGPVPFVVQYQHDGRSETLYFNTSFKSCFAHTEGNNRHWYETLYEILTKYRRSKAVGQRNQPLVKA